jgi:hypothetical protein
MFEIIKDAKSYNSEEKCTCCDGVMSKVFSSPQLMAINDKPEYNPALGTVIRNKSHLKNIVKEKGLIEVGTEKPDTIRKHSEKTKQQRWKNRWDSV